MPEVADVDGLGIHYRVQGEGEPVVLVHGWPAHSALWRHQMPALAERFRVYTPDLPGLGSSDKPLDVRYTLDFQTRALTGFLKVLGIERAAFVCHDLGGAVVLLFAVRHPEQVTRLVVTDTTPYPDMPLLLRTLFFAVRLPGVGRAIASRFGSRMMFRIGTIRRGQAISELTDLYYRPCVDDPAARKTLLATFADLDVDDLAEVADNLGRINAPTLIL